jgi:RND family efflux transporter MFP subunit
LGTRTLPAHRVSTEIPADLATHPRYRLTELLGAGGMGAVFKAEHLLMKRTVAVKVIDRALFTDPAMAGRFGREMEAAGKLTHPNIVHAYDAEGVGDTHFLAMEYVEGVSLAKLLTQRGPLPVAEACSYIRQAAFGLQHAHERGMVHRDIKPQNLMVTSDGQVKILDFGLARFVLEAAPAGALLASTTDDAAVIALQDTRLEPLTQAGTVMGTPAYIAPEQARDPHTADIRADIYSLGCTLYDLLTGRPPFPEGTAGRQVISHLREAPRSLTELRPEVPRELAQVVEKMLAKDPARRYQAPAAVAAALAPWAKGAAVAESRSRRRRRVAIAAAVAVALTVVGYLLAAPILDFARLLVPPQVLVSRPVERRVTDYVELTGQTDTANAVKIRPRLSGHLQKVAFLEGDLVQAGQVLFEIDPRPTQTLLDEARAKLSRLEAQLKAGTTPSIEATRADISIIQAEMERLKLALEFSKVIAPINGRIGQLHVTRGDVVTADETLLVTLVAEDPMFAYFHVPEATALRIRPWLGPKKAVYIRLANEEDYRHEAVVDFVNNQVNKGTLTVRATIANPVLPAGHRLLTAGLSVHARLPVGAPHPALLVKRPGKKEGLEAPLEDVLYLVDERNKVVRRSVKWGQEHDGLTVVTEGLQPGDRVIVEWTEVPQPGQIVQANLVEMPGSRPKAAAPK